ncbi:MAG: hypothetical protein R2704_17450 [Microthrixaceae bacterium]
MLRRTKRSKNLPDAPAVPEDTAAEVDDGGTRRAGRGREADAVEVDLDRRRGGGRRFLRLDPDDDLDRDHDRRPRPRQRRCRRRAACLPPCGGAAVRRAPALRSDYARTIGRRWTPRWAEHSIDRVWQGPELVVGMLDEHLVEEASTTWGGQSAWSDGADQWCTRWGGRSAAGLLAESLLVAGIACAWDEAADLHVSASDEDAVDATVGAMPDPDEVFEEAEGTEVQDLLTQLYAAVDRLKDNPKIPGARLDVAEGRPHGPPGRAVRLDAHQWRICSERAADLRRDRRRRLPPPPPPEGGRGRRGRPRR